MENCRKVKFEIYFLTAFEMKTVNKISQQFMLKYISCLSFNIPIMVISLKDREGVDREFFLLRVMNIIFLLFVPIFLSTQILSNLSFIASKEQEKYLYFCKLLQQLKTPKPYHFAKAQGKGRELLLLLVIIPRPSCHCLFGFQQPCAQQFFLSEPRLLVSKRVNRRHQGGIHQILRQVGRQLTNYVCRQ